MKNSIRKFAYVLATGATLSTGAALSAPVGVNMEGVAPWARQIVFVDTMKRTRENWAVFEITPTGQWGVEQQVPVDSNGYPLELPYTPPGSTTPLGVASYLFYDMEGHYPAGNYTLIFEGTGGLIIGNGENEQFFSVGGSYTFTVDPSQGDLMVVLIESQVADPIRNIRFIMPGHETTYECQPFYPPLLNRLRDFQAVRFAQTMRTNDGDYPCDNGVAATHSDCTKVWENRNTVGHRTQATPRGVALEYLIDLANSANVDAWLNVPHGADDNYVREFARLVRDRLNPDLQVYLELSNEMFNFDAPYPQSRWAMAAGLAQGLSTDPTQARLRFVTKRSTEIFRIFEQEFGTVATQRLVKVIAGFIAIPTENEVIFTALNDTTINPDGIRPDLFAVGAYFGGMVVDVANLQGENESITPAEIVQRAYTHINVTEPDPFDPGWVIESLESLIQANAAIAQANNIPMVAYEGGQHIIQTNGWDNDPVLGEKAMTANRLPAMRAAYQQLHDTWAAHNGGLMMHYTLINRASTPWGSFGLLEWTDQDPTASVKYSAVMEWSAQ